MEAVVAITLLSTLVLSVLSVFAAASRNRAHGDQRTTSALVLSQELSRVWADPGRFLVPAAQNAWVRETALPPEYADRTVEWRWSDDPSGLADLALVRVRVSWRDRTSLGDSSDRALRDVPRQIEGAVLVERP